MNKKPFCSGCKHAQFMYWYGVACTRHGFRRVIAPFGGRAVSFYPNVDTERNPGWLYALRYECCGPNGRFFEAKDVQPEIIATDRSEERLFEAAYDRGDFLSMDGPYDNPRKNQAWAVWKVRAALEGKP